MMRVIPDADELPGNGRNERVSFSRYPSPGGQGYSGETLPGRSAVTGTSEEAGMGVVARGDATELVRSKRPPCAYVKPGGQRCGGGAMPGFDFCWNHRPDLSEERSRVAQNRGREAPEPMPAGEPRRPALEPWAVREKKDRERRRRNNRLAWISHHEQMAELHRDLAAEHERKALALLEEGRG